MSSCWWDGVREEYSPASWVSAASLMRLCPEACPGAGCSPNTSSSTCSAEAPAAHFALGSWACPATASGVYRASSSVTSCRSAALTCIRARTQSYGPARLYAALGVTDSLLVSQLKT